MSLKIKKIKKPNLDLLLSLARQFNFDNISIISGCIFIASLIAIFSLWLAHLKPDNLFLEFKLKFISKPLIQLKFISKQEIFLFLLFIHVLKFGFNSINFTVHLQNNRNISTFYFYLPT